MGRWMLAILLICDCKLVLLLHLLSVNPMRASPHFWYIARISHCAIWELLPYSAVSCSLFCLLHHFLPSLVIAWGLVYVFAFFIVLLHVPILLWRNCFPLKRGYVLFGDKSMNALEDILCCDDYHCWQRYNYAKEYCHRYHNVQCTACTLWN